MGSIMNLIKGENKNMTSICECETCVKIKEAGNAIGNIDCDDEYLINILKGEK